jgi:hypothetical protein
MAKKISNEKEALVAVQEDGSALYYVPDNLKTLELCLLAVEQDATAFYDVPDNLKTVEMCLSAVQQEGRTLSNVPDSLKTVEMCLAAVQQDGKALEYVPVSLRTVEMCLAAVQQTGRALFYVPDNNKTTEICLVAVQDDIDMLVWVPDALEDTIRKKLVIENVEKDAYERVVYIFIKGFSENDMEIFISSEMSKMLFSEIYEVYMKQPPLITALSGTLSSSYDEIGQAEIKGLFKSFPKHEYLIILEKFDHVGLEEGDDYLDYWFNSNSSNVIKHGTSTFQKIEDIDSELYGMCREIRDLWLDDDLSGVA